MMLIIRSKIQAILQESLYINSIISLPEIIYNKMKTTRSIVLLVVDHTAYVTARVLVNVTPCFEGHKIY